MGDFLGEFFTADKIFKGLGIDKICDIPEASYQELQGALKGMAKGKCKDRRRVFMEMILHGGRTLQEHVLTLFNRMLRDCEVEDNWCETLFTLLPKKGDLMILKTGVRLLF